MNIFFFQEGSFMSYCRLRTASNQNWYFPVRWLLMAGLKPCMNLIQNIFQVNKEEKEVQVCRQRRWWRRMNEKKTRLIKTQYVLSISVVRWNDETNEKSLNPAMTKSKLNHDVAIYEAQLLHVNFYLTVFVLFNKHILYVVQNTLYVNLAFP